jgi:hypothetical protein
VGNLEGGEPLTVMPKLPDYATTLANGLKRKRWEPLVLAQMVGYTTDRQIKEMLRGEHPPRVDKIDPICAALGLDCGQFRRECTTNNRTRRDGARRHERKLLRQAEVIAHALDAGELEPGDGRALVELLKREGLA